MPLERLYERIRQGPPRNCENNVSPTFDALSDGDPLKLSGFYLSTHSALELTICILLVELVIGMNAIFNRICFIIVQFDIYL